MEVKVFMDLTFEGLKVEGFVKDADREENPSFQVNGNR